MLSGPGEGSPFNESKNDTGIRHVAGVVLDNDGYNIAVIRGWILAISDGAVKVSERCDFGAGAGDAEGFSVQPAVGVGVNLIRIGVE